MLSSDEQIRFSRQTVLDEIGHTGQVKLKTTSVLVVGAGGLGCPILTYLVRAGIGKVGIIDGDRVDLSNLQRQTLYTTNDIGQWKVEVARSRLMAVNPRVHIETYADRLTAENARNIVQQYDIVVDGSDNFPTRYLVNDACVLADKPLVYGAVHQFEGQVCVFNLQRNSSERGPNYRDLHPNPPAPGLVPDCSTAGVMGIVPGLIGLMQANEVMKVALDSEHVLDGRLLIYDARSGRTHFVNIANRVDNPLTGDQPSQFDLIDYESFCGIDVPPSELVITGDQLRALGIPGEHFLLVDVRTKEEVEPIGVDTVHIPLSQLAQRIGSIERYVTVVFFCQTGQRSRQAAQLYNRERKTQSGKSLVGGVTSLSVFKS